MFVLRVVKSLEGHQEPTIGQVVAGGLWSWLGTFARRAPLDLMRLEAQPWLSRWR